MNILYTNFHKAIGGGHTTYIENLLHNPLHGKFVACPHGSRLYQNLAARGFPGLTAVDFPTGLNELAAIIKNARLLAKTIEQHNIDIVHTNGSADNRLVLYASLICRKAFKTVFTKHNTYKIKGFFSRLRLKHFNAAVILVGPQVAQAAHMGSSPKFHVVEHGVDLAYWKKQTPVHAPGKVIRLVSNSGTSPHKGWTDMVEALAGLEEHDRKRFSVTVLGKPAAGQEQAAQRCDIHFPGYQEDPRPWLEEADVGFVLSHHEASSYAAREMMAMSLPVILSDFAGHEPAYNPACGWVVGVQNPQSVRAVLQNILAMPPEHLTAMKTAARRKAETDFSLEKCLAETNAVYASLEQQSVAS